MVIAVAGARAVRAGVVISEPIIHRLLGRRGARYLTRRPVSVSVGHLQKSIERNVPLGIVNKSAGARARNLTRIFAEGSRPLGLRERSGGGGVRRKRQSTPCTVTFERLFPLTRWTSSHHSTPSAVRRNSPIKAFSSRRRFIASWVK